MKYSVASSIAIAAITAASVNANSIAITTDANGFTTTISHPSSVYSSSVVTVATPTPANSVYSSPVVTVVTPTPADTTTPSISTVTATPPAVRPYPVCIVYVSEAPGVTVPVTTYSTSRAQVTTTYSTSRAQVTTASTYYGGYNSSFASGNTPSVSGPTYPDTTYYATPSSVYATPVATVTTSLVTRSALTSITATIYTTSAGQVTTVYPTGYHGSIPSSIPYCNSSYPAPVPLPVSSVVTVSIATPSPTLLSSNEGNTAGNAQNALGKSGASMLKSGVSAMLVGVAAGIAAVAL